MILMLLLVMVVGDGLVVVCCLRVPVPLIPASENEAAVNAHQGLHGNTSVFGLGFLVAGRRI